jgi:hypothetical protein
MVSALAITARRPTVGQRGSTPGPMMRRPHRRSFGAMKRHLTPHNLIVLALTAVFSLACTQAVELGSQILGSGTASTPALIGDAAGVLGCALSARFGLRRLYRAQTC